MSKTIQIERLLESFSEVLDRHGDRVWGERGCEYIRSMVDEALKILSMQVTPWILNGNDEKTKESDLALWKNWERENEDYRMFLSV